MARMLLCFYPMMKSNTTAGGLIHNSAFIDKPISTIPM